MAWTRDEKSFMNVQFRKITLLFKQLKARISGIFYKDCHVYDVEQHYVKFLRQYGSIMRLEHETEAGFTHFPLGCTFNSRGEVAEVRTKCTMLSHLGLMSVIENNDPQLWKSPYSMVDKVYDPPKARPKLSQGDVALYTRNKDDANNHLVRLVYADRSILMRARNVDMEIGDDGILNISGKVMVGGATETEDGKYAGVKYKALRDELDRVWAELKEHNHGYLNTAGAPTPTSAPGDILQGSTKGISDINIKEARATKIFFD